MLGQGKSKTAKSKEKLKQRITAMTAEMQQLKMAATPSLEAQQMRALAAEVEQLKARLGTENAATAHAASAPPFPGGGVLAVQSAGIAPQPSSIASTPVVPTGYQFSSFPYHAFQASYDVGDGSRTWELDGFSARSAGTPGLTRNQRGSNRTAISRSFEPMTPAEELRYAAALAPNGTLVVPEIQPRPPTPFGPIPQERIRIALRDMHLDPQLRAQISQPRREPLPDDSPPRSPTRPATSGTEVDLISSDTPVANRTREEESRSEPGNATTPVVAEARTSIESASAGGSAMFTHTFSMGSAALVAKLMSSPVFSCRDVGIPEQVVSSAFAPHQPLVDGEDLARAGLAGVTTPGWEDAEAPLVAIRKSATRASAETSGDGAAMGQESEDEAEFHDASSAAVFQALVEGVPILRTSELHAALQGQPVVPPELR